MEINASITGIKYQIYFSDKLNIADIESFNINESPSSCLLKGANVNVAISKWVSPKRTRSYPYERVYNTLINSRRITIIPILKDEGADGDRDFLQWDTISLMSLLDVYVVLAYYENAEKNERYKNKITNQIFDNEYVRNKISEITNYHSSALHWNLQEISQNLHNIVERAKIAYQHISANLGVKMHQEKGIQKFQKAIEVSAKNFMEFSRQKAQAAQIREFQTLQPKEYLTTLSKAKLTISNYLGGQYYFTVDEVLIENGTLYLIEGKHTKNSLLPSKSDIRDGLLKMILYSNLKTVTLLGIEYPCKPILLLTSAQLKANINSQTIDNELIKSILKCNDKQNEEILQLFEEARQNGFEVILKSSN